MPQTRPPASLLEQGKLIDKLLRQIERLPDPGARDLFRECLQSLLSLYGDGWQRVLHLVDRSGAGANELRQSLLHDELISGLLLIHNLHPVPLETRLRDALARIRPYLTSHGGDVQLLGLENEFARLRLVGSCESCPSSVVTMELAIRSALEEACPDLAGFEVEGVKRPPESNPPMSLQNSESEPRSAVTWVDVPGISSLADNKFIAAEVRGSALLICQLNGRHYAYRDHCPACNLPLHLGTLREGFIHCSLGHAYNVQLAGRALKDNSAHLFPLPLLVDNGHLKVAVNAKADSVSHDLDMVS